MPMSKSSRCSGWEVRLAEERRRTPTGLTNPYAIDELSDLGENKQHELDEATQLVLKGFTPSQRTFAVDIS
ncbi:uncharacterized protein CLUP02_04413 [Colletotrichum lupini]|uniref:Uncharacterized protein n=1 Tax=Colletotrichum lupini TaxID=145971 RepID=A0A9Q8SK97_9PEZI|nr:uncharacterized protein CLUP02_04413 [Colletotrichum lupini]UQC78934.1 hypothetical protein CLUP02_04413 [Colletotrichum lupini]